MSFISIISASTTVKKKEKEIKNYSTKVDEILLAGLRAR